VPALPSDTELQVKQCSGFGPRQVAQLELHAVQLVGLLISAKYSPAGQPAFDKHFNVSLSLTDPEGHSHTPSTATKSPRHVLQYSVFNNVVVVPVGGLPQVAQGCSHFSHNSTVSPSCSNLILV